MTTDGTSPASPVRKRAFFAIWPPAEIAQQLHAHACALVQRHAQLAHARGIPTDSFHLTLAFLGSVSGEDIEALKQLAAELEPPQFEVLLDCVVSWRGAGVVWAGATQPCQPLMAFVAKLKAALVSRGFPVDAREFAAHISLFRNARVKVSDALQPPLCWPVSGFRLVESKPAPRGSVYVPLWQGGGPPGL